MSVATSAIRDATNGEQFLADAAGRDGADDRDAVGRRRRRYYGYVAAVNTTTLTDGVVLDIGGGSLQLIHVDDRPAPGVASFPLGAVRVTEQFLPGRRPRQEEGAGHGCATTSPRRCRALDWLALLGPAAGRASAGAVRNLAAAAQAANGSLDLGVQGFLITPEGAL